MDPDSKIGAKNWISFNLSVVFTNTEAFNVQVTVVLCTVATPPHQQVSLVECVEQRGGGDIHE